MKTLLSLGLLALAACGVKHTSIDYGKTTRADLVSEKGLPLAQSKVPVADSEVLSYQDNEKYQLKGDVVEFGFKDPRGDQKTLLYWRHKFRDCDVVTTRISVSRGHELPEYQMKCPEQGLTVIYTEGSEYISRIVEHEKQ